MRRVELPHTDLRVSSLCFGGNVFGWTADEAQSHTVLDAFVEAGGNFIDTADAYGAWVEGNPEGASELIIGSWLAGRSDRDDLVIATKVGLMPGHEGLRRDNVIACAEASIDRLRCGHIDLYYAHSDDSTTPLEETLSAFDELVRRGLVRYIAASNYEAPRLAEALATSDRHNYPGFVGLQTHYNLMERIPYEDTLAKAVARLELSSLPYYALANGFLTGKYAGGQAARSARAEIVEKYFNARGERVLSALAEVAIAHGVSRAAIALAWLASRPYVSSPLVSARTPAQLADLVEMDRVELSSDQLALLNVASDRDPVAAAGA